MGTERQTRKLGNFLGGTLSELRVSVQAGAHGSSADGKIVKTRQRILQPFDVAIEEVHPARHFLPDGERSSIHQVRTANFDHGRKGACFFVNGIAQLGDRGDQELRDKRSGGNVHGGRKSVVGGLRHIYVIVGVNRLFAAHYSTGYFDSAIRDHLV